MVNKNNLPLVSVLFVAEGDPSYAARIFNTLAGQSYKNLEIIVTYLDNDRFDITKFQEDVETHGKFDINTTIDYVPCSEAHLLIDKGIESIDSESQFCFLKTSQPIIWAEFHILAHVEKWQDRLAKKKTFQLSNVAVRDIDYDINHPFGAITYRMENPKFEQITLDEISFRAPGVANKVKFHEYLAKPGDEKPGFNMKTFYSTMKTAGIILNDEITIYHLIPVQKQDPNQNIQKIDTNFNEPSKIVTLRNGVVCTEEEALDPQPDDELIVSEKFATIGGNKEWDAKHNWNVIKKIENYIELGGDKLIKKIGIKRTMGMGDVILTYPFVKYLGEKFPNAEIVYYTVNNPGNILSITNFLDTNISNIKTYDIKNSFDDVLASDKDLDLRYDLDMAYESRGELTYAEAYFISMGYEVPEGYSLTPKFKDLVESDNPFNSGEKVVSFNPIGSGWGGKELSPNKWAMVLKTMREKGYKIALALPSYALEKYSGLLSDGLIDYHYNDEDGVVTYNKMLQYIYYSNLYMGSDNGPMHIATAYDKPVFAVNGAALLERVTHSNKTVSVRNEVECLGCKHRFFYKLNGNSLTFVPECTNSIKYDCMNISDEVLLEDINILLELDN